MADSSAIDDSIDDSIDDEQLVLGDLLNHVLDKGVVISGNVTISIADIDLLVVDLRLLLTSVESSLRRGLDRSLRAISSESEQP
jgi:gas vesicle structural protein